MAVERANRRRKLVLWADFDILVAAG
jgi:hypothetical protein